MVDSDNFYGFWLPALGLLVAGLLWSVRSRGSAAATPERRPRVLPSLIVLAGAVVVMAVVTVPGAGWGFSDEDVFITAYLRGSPYPPPIWEWNGRFFPLGHQEWRLVYTWTSEAGVYHGVAVAQYVAYGLGCLLLLRELRALSPVGLLLLLVLPPVVVAFSTLVVSERTQVMFMPWLLLALLRWDTTLAARYGFCALICAHVMLYLKEPTVVFIGMLALLRLAPVVSPAVRGAAGGDQGELRSLGLRSWVDGGLLAMSAVFLVLYFTAFPPGALLSAERVYDGREVEVGGLPDAVVAWFEREPLAVLLLAAGIARCAWLAARRRPLGLVEKALLAAGAYFLALAATGLVSAFYAALPLTAATIAWLVWLRGAETRSAAPATAYATTAIAGVSVVAVALLMSAPHVAYQQDWVDRNNGLARELRRMSHERGAAPSAFVTGHSWDAEMVAVLTNGYYGLRARFAIADERYEPNAGKDTASLCGVAPANCLLYARSPPAGVMVIDLGALESRRSAVVRAGEEVVWRYEGERLDILMRVTPRFLRPFLREQYNFW